jgi:hypothetical protein
MNDGKSFLIPTTGHKTKLPKTMSYPIGAELVSQGLAGVPQQDDLRLSFTYHSSFEKEYKHDHPFKIFEARFDKSEMDLTMSNEFIEQGAYEEKWDLTVYPVPREKRSAAHRLLLEEGLPGIAKWLATERTPLWKTGHKTISIFFDQAEESISFQEE